MIFAVVFLKNEVMLLVFARLRLRGFVVSWLDRGWAFILGHVPTPPLPDTDRPVGHGPTHSLRGTPATADSDGQTDGDRVD